ncbi:glycosyltransferase family 2 protein [Halomarina oriensis]|uniref:Glycosyltransferase n=1 Tax=Halomarina oriensis TaxID=671145 RepID=A0A6B0GKK1_9EURY|nr:glycosyltransferase family 2 protein [Halomarina oriensis]MWG35456.1 glycosyltransferase [Halomarina oriensis]
MKLSVVVPTLNGREHLRRCLDSLRTHAPDAETLVVNGPSVDGTTGMVRDRSDVDVLVEIDERNVNVARNAGIERASGDAIAFLDYAYTVEAGWSDAIRESLDGTAGGHRASGHGPDLASVVTGPVHRSLRGGVSTESAERRAIGGRSVTYFAGGNVAFAREVLDAVDGFDEYLLTGGARDAAHRLAAAGYDVEWLPKMTVCREETAGEIRQPSLRADGGEHQRDWYWRYRSLSYRLTKNYGTPSTAWRVTRHAFGDGGRALADVARGESSPSKWWANGSDVAVGALVGLKDGVGARFRDRSSVRNPSGLSTRGDRAVAVYDRRDGSSD